MSIEAPVRRPVRPSRTSTATDASGSASSGSRRDEYFAYVDVADRQARHVDRRVPQGAPARRRLGLLLRHRQLRRGHRHRQPLRHRRPVRRPLQRRLPQGRARPPRELRRRRSSRRRSRRCSTTGPTRASTRSPAPTETGSAFGAKHGENRAAITRHRVTAARMVSVPGDEGLRNDENGHPVNRQFLDVPQDEPEIHAEPGFEDEINSFNLFAYLSRSEVTWNPSVVSVCGDSLFCPTTEEYILPIIHGNDRVEWFIQLSDEIIWDVEDRDTGTARAKVMMRAGRRRGHAGRHPPPGLRAEAVDAAGLGERRPRPAGAISSGQLPSVPGRVLDRSTTRRIEPTMTLVSRAEVQIQARLFIGGEFVDAARRRTFPTTTRTTTVIAEVAEARRRPTSTGPWPPRARRSRPGRGCRPPSAGRLLLRARRRHRGGRPRSWPRSSRSTPAIPIRDIRNLDVPADRGDVPLLRRHGRQGPGRRRPGRARLPELRHARAARRGRADRALELPADVLQLEDGPGARRRQHGRA